METKCKDSKLHMSKTDFIRVRMWVYRAKGMSEKVKEMSKNMTGRELLLKGYKRKLRQVLKGRGNIEEKKK